MPMKKLRVTTIARYWADMKKINGSICRAADNATVLTMLKIAMEVTPPTTALRDRGEKMNEAVEAKGAFET
ncbi:hypothetical protein HDV05_007831, partial [Chytridiales sp. JEL 0842]